MGVKRGNLKLISGALLPSFVLNYILIRIKERGFWKKENRKNKRERENRTRKKEEQSFGNFLA